MIFNSLLIANRGEIACRIIKTAREMGIKSIAVYVDADKDALFVKEADESVKLEDGGYLDGDQIINAAKPRWLRIGGYWYPRGGIPIDIFFQTGEPPQGLWLPDQGVPSYRGRG